MIFENEEIIIYIYYVGKCVRRCKCTMILWKVYLKNDKKSYILCIGCKYVIDENEKKKKMTKKCKMLQKKTT